MRFYTGFTLAFMSALIALAACNQTSTPTIAGLGGGTAAAGGSATALAISPNQIQMITGATYQLNTNAPSSLQSQVQWNSLETTIATISPSGLVSAVAPGTATITASYASDTTGTIATASVVVSSPTTP